MTVSCTIHTLFLQDGGQICDFQEYVYGPKSHWPTDAQIEEYNSGREEWPCSSYPAFRCKCGILACRGIVPSELGKGWYCGNSYGDFWVSFINSYIYCGRTCLIIVHGLPTLKNVRDAIKIVIASHNDVKYNKIGR